MFFSDSSRECYVCLRCMREYAHEIAKKRAFLCDCSGLLLEKRMM